MSAASNVMPIRASSIVEPKPAITAARAIALGGASVASAGIAAALVAVDIALGLSLLLRLLEGKGVGGIAAVVVLAIPVVAVFALVGPFAAGLVGGFAGSRPIAAVGSVSGVFAGYWVGLTIGGRPESDSSSVEGMVALVSTLSVVTLVGHFTALSLRPAVDSL